jgi:cytochrome P450
MIPGFNYLPLKANQENDHAITTLTNIFEDMIKKKRSAMDTDKRQLDLLDLLLDCEDEATGFKFTDRQIIHSIPIGSLFCYN